MGGTCGEDPTSSSSPLRPPFPSSVVSGDRVLSWEAGGPCSRSVCPWASPFLLGLLFPTCHVGLGGMLSLVA